VPAAPIKKPRPGQVDLTIDPSTSILTIAISYSTISIHYVINISQPSFNVIITIIFFTSNYTRISESDKAIF
jgi:hypothetical protein